MCFSFLEPWLQWRCEWHLDMKPVTSDLSLWWNRVFPFGNHCSKKMAIVCCHSVEQNSSPKEFPWESCFSQLPGHLVSCPLLNVRSSPLPLLFRALSQALRNKGVGGGCGIHPGVNRGDIQSQGRDWGSVPGVSDQSDQGGHEGAEEVAKLTLPFERMTGKWKGQIRQECASEAGLTDALAGEGGIRRRSWAIQERKGLTEWSAMGDRKKPRSRMGRKLQVERTVSSKMKTETDFLGRRGKKAQDFILETCSPGIKCLYCDLEKVQELLKLWFHHLQNRITDAYFADEVCILHQPSACSCYINESSSDYFVSHLRKAGGKDFCRREIGREWFGAWREVSHQGNKTNTQSEGD